MTAITLIQAACFDDAILLTTAFRTVKARRPTPFIKRLMTLFFRAIVLKQLKQTIACLKLDFIFSHDCNLIVLLTVFDSQVAVKLLRLVRNQEDL